MMSRILLYILSISVSCYAMGADSNRQALTVYAIPGQNGAGSDPWYVEGVVGKSAKIIPVNTPSILPDLGQYFCQRHLNDALTNNADRDNAIIYATSQGTATALNYLAHNPSPNIKAVVLEAALASGNSAAYHTATRAMGMTWLDSIPGSYYVLSYLASLLGCFGYRPAGQQAIQSIDALPKDLPVVIIHSRYDRELPFDGARALYYRLRANGNDNAYLIEKGGYNHIAILQNEREKNDVRQILNRHLKQDGSSEQHGSHEFQPEPSQFKAQYESLISKERKHAYLEPILGAAICLMAVKKLSSYFRSSQVLK